MTINARVVGVQFKINSELEKRCDRSFYFNDNVRKTYHYLTLDESIKVGDEVIVDSPSMGMVVVKVVDVDVDSKAASKWIVQKVNAEEYKERLERQKELAKIEKALKEEIKKVDATKQYEMYAKENSVVADLLAQLKKLQES